MGYLDRKVRLVPDLREVWSYINPFMLFGRHWAIAAISRSGWRSASRRRWNCLRAMEEVKEEAAKFMKVRAVWQFFEAEAEGERCIVFAPGGATPLHTLEFEAAESRRSACA